MVLLRNHKREHLTAADFLRWNAHQFQLEKLTVVGDEIDYVRHRREVSGELGFIPWQTESLDLTLQKVIYSVLKKQQKCGFPPKGSSRKVK